MSGLTIEGAGSLHLYRQDTWKLEDYVHRIVTAPHLPQMAAADSSGNILWWGEGEDPCSLWQAHEGFVEDIALTPACDALYTAGENGELFLWRTGDPTPACEATLKNPGRLAFDPQTQRLAAVSGRRVQVRDAELNLLWESPDHPATPEDICWLPNGKALAVCTMGGAWLHNPEGDIPSMHLEFQAAFLSLTAAPDGKLLAGGCLDQAVRLWQLPSARLLHLEGYTAKVKHLAFDPRGGFLVSGSGRDLVIWDVREDGPEGKEPVLFTLPEGQVEALAFHPSGRMFAAGTSEGDLAIFSIEGHSGALLPIWQGRLPHPVSALGFLAKCPLLAAGAASGEILMCRYDFKEAA